MVLDLPLIWSGIIAFGVFMYVLLDGFDLGVGILFPFARHRAERDVMMNSIAPIWDGNETWLVLGGGGLLAAFPLAYATLLPALYLPLMVMLFGLIFRGVAFEFRHSTGTRVWWWDLAFAGGSVVATVAQGIVLGSFITGFDFRDGQVTGGPFLWLTPFNLTVGVCLVGGYALLGATWLVMKTDGIVQGRSYGQAFTLAILVAVGMGLISASTPLTHPDVAARWFAWPNFVLLLPVPLVTVGVWVSTPAQHRRSPRDTALPPQHGAVRAGLSRARRVDVALSRAAAPDDLGGGRTADLARLSAGRRGDPDPGDPVLHRVLVLGVPRQGQRGSEGYH